MNILIKILINVNGKTEKIEINNIRKDTSFELGL